MANIKSAIKRNRQNIIRRSRNRHNISTMRSSIKTLRKVIESGDGNAAAEQLARTCSEIDRACRKGAIHDNTASRLKSRLSVRVNKLGS